MNDLLYVIPANSKKEDIIATLKQHPEIKFVSLVGIDLAGNDTDEKIPMRVFLEDIDSFYNGSAVQTDGSSVVLTGIATLNNAKVDMPIDPTVNWFVDYNIESYDDELGKPVGTLRIPAALIHDGKAVDSRSILANTLTYVKKGLLDLFKNNAKISGLEHINGADVKDIVFTSATELEFWVKTPLSEADIPEMSASQVMQEQYWQRTRGAVRTALEQCMLALEAYGLSPEMGHKEVGGMKGHMDTDGNMTHVCEQVEIDWKFADALQAADNELVVRILVKEIFRENGLEVNFKAKPMIGLAGNGEHTHFGIGAIMNDGSFVNLFAPTDMKKDFMSAVGYGAIMGLLKNYEVINPFVSATNDSLNRLKPGFEAPVCIVTSLGHKPEVPSRNRTILAGLIRDVNNPKATRFELRACNPYTNTYLVLAAIYTSILDGVKYAVTKTTAELLAEISKDVGEGNFGADGIVGPHAEKEGSYYTIKEVWCPVQLTWNDVEKGELTLSNQYNFVNLKDCRFSYRLLQMPAMGSTQVKVLKQGNLSSPDVAPGKEAKVKIPMMANADAVEIKAVNHDGEEIMTWSRGVKSEERSVKNSSAPSTSSASSAVYADQADAVEVKAGGRTYRFTKKDGRLMGVEVGSKGKCYFQMLYSYFSRNL